MIKMEVIETFYLQICRSCLKWNHNPISMERWMGWEGSIQKLEEETTDRLGDQDIDEGMILMDFNKINIRV